MNLNHLALLAVLLATIGCAKPEISSSKSSDSRVVGARVIAWLTCDSVSVDGTNGKHHIEGVYSRISASVFPVAKPSLSWFTSLVGVGKGEHEFRLEIGLSENAMSELVRERFTSTGESHVINLINDVKDITFPIPGDYIIRIVVDGKPLFSGILFVEST